MNNYESVSAFVNENEKLKQQIKRLKYALYIALFLLFSCSLSIWFNESRNAVKMANSEEISTGAIRDISHHCIVSEFAKIDSLSSVALSDSMALSVIKEFDIQHPYIVLAQMKIESGNYQSKLANSNNNYFGMRHPAQRLTVSLGNKNGYARYRNWAYSILDYALWQRRYTWNLTEEEYLTKLSNTYAEDPNYISKVKNIAKNLENEK